MLERARVAGQLPARASVYADARFAGSTPFDPVTVRDIVERATARPPTPMYAELSEALQIELHRALTLQTSPRAALAAATERSRHILRRPQPRREPGWIALLVLGAAAGAVALLWLRRPPSAPSRPRRDARLAYALIAPALLVIASVALVPLGHLLWESAHVHDLRRPWLGREFVGLSNYEALLASARFWGALARTAAFATVSVVLELGLGLCVALVLNGSFRGRGVVRAVSLLPWTIPTVVAAMAFRFVFDARGADSSWLSHPVLAWVPVIAADVWKTTPFVALLLLAGLQTIDRGLYDAAAIDGANRVQRFFAVTLPGLRHVMLVTLLFRLLDAFRVFDLIYVLTQGGPGIATEPIAQFTWKTVLERLDFGGGAALSLIVFALTALLVVPYLRLLQPQQERR
jgi:ABC-type sugar transport system permease subunit